jgi:class 3 adenylate cyclase
VGAAVTAGSAVVGSMRTGRGQELRWAWAAEGEPVEHAAQLARSATAGSVLVSGEVASAVRHQFVVQPAGDDSFLVRPRADDHDAGAPGADRRVATVLVTNLVGATRMIERLGDRAGGGLMAAHERATRAELVVHGGHELNTTGDGLLAVFDSPAGAIRCAFGVLTRVRYLGLAIRAGVHTGEVEYVAGVARGLALHVAAAIAARATPGEVLVSTTTRDLAAGADDVAFVDRGQHQLKGFAEPRPLFAAVEDRGTVEEVPRARAVDAPAPAVSQRSMVCSDRSRDVAGRGTA